MAEPKDASPGGQEDAVEMVLRIAGSIASRPVLDARPPDEIIGYNDFGVPE